MRIKKLKEKFEKDFVVIYRGRYWGLNFDKREVREISFEDAFGCSFFDWDNNICIASEYLKKRYEEERGETGVSWIGGIVRMAWKGHPLLEIKKEVNEK